MGNTTSNPISKRQIQEDAKKHGVINLNSLNLSSVPPFFKYKIDLNAITTFEAENNKLTSIPEGISLLKNLLELNLSGNNIEKFSTPPLLHLRKLNLGFNPLVELPGDLEAAPSLELIICYNCKLRSLPVQCLLRMPNLSVMVNGNALSIGYDHIPSDVCPRLQGINDQHVPSEILENFLYLGAVGSASHWDELKRLQIRHVVCMVHMFELPFVGKVTYKTVHIDDIETADIKQYFDTINQFITSVKVYGGRVLVHCAAGVSRSATAVLAYLMATKRMSYQQARDYVLHRRPCICPNDGFEKQLLEYEGVLRTRELNASR